MFDTWTPAVLPLMNRASPIWRFVRPSREEHEDLALARRQPEGIVGIGGWNG